METLTEKLDIKIGDKDLWAIIDKDGHTIIQVLSILKPTKEFIKSIT